jgi:RNA polymerase sigma-70 factor (ECF subfamily)
MRVPRNESVDSEAFRAAFETYRETLVAIAWRVLRDRGSAEDVVQDAFLELWTTPTSFDSRRGSLRTYLQMLVRSRALDRWRARMVAVSAVERVRAEASAGEHTAASAADPVIRKETARTVREVVDSLPRSQREVILLTYGSGLSAPEVATVTGMPLGTAKSRMRLGLARAREALLEAEAA